MLNNQLPEDIRVLGYADVPQGFSARFNCTSRTYKYFFMGYGKNLDRMRAAAAKLVGEHNFRFFCKPRASLVRAAKLQARAKSRRAEEE